MRDAPFRGKMNDGFLRRQQKKSAQPGNHRRIGSACQRVHENRFPTENSYTVYTKKRLVAMRKKASEGYGKNNCKGIQKTKSHDCMITGETKPGQSA